MKKIIAFCLVALMMLNLSVVGFASEITATDNQQAETTVSYGVSAKYTVVIPEAVAIDMTTKTADLEVSIRDALLESQMSLSVSVESQNNWMLTDANNSSNTLGYACEMYYRTDVDGDGLDDVYVEPIDGYQFLMLFAGASNTSAQLRLCLYEIPTKSGVYNDILTWIVQYEVQSTWCYCGARVPATDFCLSHGCPACYGEKTCTPCAYCEECSDEYYSHECTYCGNPRCMCACPMCYSCGYIVAPEDICDECGFCDECCQVCDFTGFKECVCLEKSGGIIDHCHACEITGPWCDICNAIECPCNGCNNNGYVHTHGRSHVECYGCGACQFPEEMACPECGICKNCIGWYGHRDICSQK